VQYVFLDNIAPALTNSLQEGESARFRHGADEVIEIELQIAAVQESVVGTFETCRGGLMMSVVRGRPEVTGTQPIRRV
jgi:hypothetical protein